MAKAIRVGDQVTLPSGLSVKVTVAAVAERPWGAIETGHLWHVCREHGHDRPSVSFYFHANGRHPLQLDEADARALAELLNLAVLTG